MTITTMSYENEIKRTKCGAGVEFNPAQHEYKKNGVIIPSVTTIIRQVFGYKYGAVSPEVLERARAKGTEVHLEAITEAVGGGRLPVCRNTERGFLRDV